MTMVEQRKVPRRWYPFAELPVESFGPLKSNQAMKKLFSLFLFALLASASAFAQQGPASYAAQESAVELHDRSGSGFALNASRITAHIKPNPLVTRSTVDAGGAVIRGIVVRDLDGREMLRDARVNAVRYSLERPMIEPGTYVVEVFTDFGATMLKLAVQ